LAGTRPVSVSIAVGPEGGWSPSELSQAQISGSYPFIGPRILRSETAAIAGVALTQHVFGDYGLVPKRWSRANGATKPGEASINRARPQVSPFRQMVAQFLDRLTHTRWDRTRPAHFLRGARHVGATDLYNFRITSFAK
jgi:hypothetical protein